MATRPSMSISKQRTGFIFHQHVRCPGFWALYGIYRGRSDIRQVDRICGAGLTLTFHKILSANSELDAIGLLSYKAANRVIMYTETYYFFTTFKPNLVP